MTELKYHPDAVRDQRIIEAWQTGDDETFIREISLANLEAAYRPRDEDDADVHPASFRASILRIYDEQDRVIAAIKDGVRTAPWYKRLFMRPMWWWATRKYPSLR